MPSFTFVTDKFNGYSLSVGTGWVQYNLQQLVSKCYQLCDLRHTVYLLTGLYQAYQLLLQEGSHMQACMLVNIPH